MAGDWTYEPEDTLADELAPLKNIQAPVYSVYGNHDEQYPGPPIQALLSHALSVNEVTDIEGQIIREAAKLIQGGGGGQPHYAQAGGKNLDGINAAVDKVIELANL